MELEFEYELINMHPELKEAFSLLRDSAQSMGIDCVILFGDFVKKNSDNTNIDLLIISELVSRDKMIKFLHNCFRSITNPLRVRLISKAGFIQLREHKPEVFNKLFNGHVCALNPLIFLQLSN